MTTPRGIISRDEVINDILKDEQYHVICYNIAKGSHMSKDLYQEVMLVLLQYNPYKLRRLYSKRRRKEFKFFFARVALNIFKRKYYDHYKQLVKSSLIWLVMEDIPAHEDGTEARGLWVDRVHKDVMEEIKRIEKEHGDAFPFDIKLFETYLQTGSLRQLEDKTGISYHDCYNTINKIKKRIQKNVSIETNNAYN